MAKRNGPDNEQVSVAGLTLHVRKGGEGSPLVVLHHDIGNQAWLPFHEELAKSFTTYVPDLPGYGQSERPEWARHPRDLAILTLQMLSELGLEQVALVGLGFGGWVAAEMATMDQRHSSAIVLAAPFGIMPQHGEILDQMMVSHIDYVKYGFKDDAEFEAHFPGEPDPELSLFWDLNREMTARIAWKPYMFSHQLPHLLAGVRTPALVIWGERDRVAPVECGELYLKALPNAELVLLPDTGHFIEMERPQELARLVEKHSRG